MSFFSGSMSVPFSDILASQSPDPTLTDRDETIEEKSEKVVREKALNLGIDDEKMHMYDDKRDGGHISDYNQKVSTIQIVR